MKNLADAGLFKAGLYFFTIIFLLKVPLKVHKMYKKNDKYLLYILSRLKDGHILFSADILGPHICHFLGALAAIYLLCLMILTY